jgi:hypothetical protein
MAAASKEVMKMKRTILFSTMAAVAAAMLTAGAQASDDRGRARTDLPPRAEWISIGQLAAKLEAQGYVIHEVDSDDGYYEVEMSDAKGMRIEADLHPVTGEPLPNRGRDD